MPIFPSVYYKHFPKYAKHIICVSFCKWFYPVTNTVQTRTQLYDSEHSKKKKSAGFIILWMLFSNNIKIVRQYTHSVMVAYLTFYRFNTWKDKTTNNELYIYTKTETQKSSFSKNKLL